MEKIGRTKIVDLLKRTDIGAMVNVKGWVRTRRGSKQVNFIALNDGSTINNLQVVRKWKYRLAKSKCWVLAIIHIHCRRKVTPWSFCAR